MSHWQKYHARWAQIQPLLRPNEDVAHALQALIGIPSRRRLPLGKNGKFEEFICKVN